MARKDKGNLGKSILVHKRANPKTFFGYFITAVILISNLSIISSVFGAPVFDDEKWRDSFEDTTGISSFYNVNISDGNVLLDGYRDDFEDHTIGELPEGWVREFGDAGSGFNRHIVANNPYEPTKSVYMLCNNDLGNFAWQKLWKHFDNFYDLIDFELTLRDISPNTNRQGYFYIKLYNSTDDLFHEVRYYWDEGRSGIPSNSSSLTTNDLIDVLPTGTSLGIKYYISENISEDIDGNTFADLASIIENISIARYGFYQDCGPDTDAWEQVYVDNVGIHNGHDGMARSIEITPPPEYDWITLEINKTEPNSQSTVSITILDGGTEIPIPGLENLLDTSIDLSAIDPSIYPSIKLQAILNGTINSTSVLHDWEVTWANIRPPDSPTGLKVSNPLNGYSLIISWNSNTELDMAHYRIYYSTDNITFYWMVDVPTGFISFIHYGLSIGVTYYYKVSAVDSTSNYSPNSTVVEGIPDIDTDLDGIGNIPDPDDDNDGIPDITDVYPLNPLNDMEIKINDIHTIVSGWNLTELEGAIAELNDSLPAIIDDLNEAIYNLSDLNTSEIMDYLKGLNASLYNELQALLTEITGVISEMMTNLKMLEANLTAQHNTLNGTLDILNNLIQNEHSQTRSELLAGLNNVLALLKSLDGNMSIHDSDIKALIDSLDDLVRNEGNLTRDQLIENVTDISNQLQTVDQNILSQLADLDTSISDQLTNLMNNITSDNDALRDWLDIVLHTINSNLTVTKSILENQLNELNLTLDNFHDDLSSDLTGIRADLMDHDNDTGQDHLDIISYLDDLINNDDLQSQDLAGLKTMLTNLAMDLSGHDQSVADEILEVVNDIDQFEENTENQMNDIEKTLEDLARLEDIINNLEALNQTLHTMNNELEESIEDKTKEEAIEDRVKFVEMLMMIVIILLIVNLIITIVMGLRKGTHKGDRKKDIPLPEENYNPPSSTQELDIERDVGIEKSSEAENAEFPPPPPLK